jgi:hypothetical protein
MYAIAERESSWDWSQHLLWEGIGLLVLIALAGLLAGLGDKGLITALIVAPVITLGLLWKVNRGDREKASAKYGRYYCEACSQHFEGDELRQITQ